MLIYPLFSIFNIWMRPVVESYRYMFIARLSGLVWHKILWWISSPHLLLVDLSTSQYTDCTHGIRQYLSKTTNAISHNTIGHFEALLLCNCIFFHPFIHFLLWVMFLLSWIAKLWIRIHWIWIRIRIGIQHFTWIRIQSGSRVLMTKNWRKKNRWKIFWSKIAIYLCPSNRRKLQPWKENIQHSKKCNLLMGHFFPPGSVDPDCESESTALLNWIWR